MNFQQPTAATEQPSVEDVESTSTTSTTTVNTSNTTTFLPPLTAAFTKVPRGVAVCIAGNLRTFTVPVVFSQIRPFHEKLWGSKVSFFLYGTLAGAGPKNQTNHNLPAINESNQTALNIAVTLLRPETVELVTNAEDVTEENIAQYVLHQECFRRIQFVQPVDGDEAFFENRVRFLRGLNQLAHVISSLQMMMRYENARGRRFKVVILTRPDLRYDVNRSDHDWFRDVAWVPEWTSNGNVALQMDHWVAMPRALAERFFCSAKF